jgi:hypothetical protein
MTPSLRVSLTCLILGAVAPEATGQAVKDSTRGDRMLAAFGVACVQTFRWVGRRDWSSNLGYNGIE